MAPSTVTIPFWSLKYRVGGVTPPPTLLQPFWNTFTFIHPILLIAFEFLQ